jgi:glyoxylase-like metal-dependent hydrolase (beta-lactamase superfamily II)
MKVTKHDDCLMMITKLGFINCFLVIEDDGVTLVDALTRGSGREILQAVSQTGRPLKRVLMTHAHSDHVGSVDEVLADSADVNFLVQERAVPILAGDVSPHDDEPKGRMLKIAYGKVSSQITDTINDGDQIGSLHAIATPGHTVEHYAFFDPRNATLIAGDSWQTLGGLAVVGDTRWRFPIPSWGTWHRPTNLNSARKTLEYKPAHLAVGHGRIFCNAEEAMAVAIARATTRIAESTSPRSRQGH